MAVQYFLTLAPAICALSGIYAAALFCYATDIQRTQEFDSHALEKAFLRAS